MMKTRQDNDMIDHIDAIYAENDTKLSWSIRSVTDYNENKIWQLHD